MATGGDNQTRRFVENYSGNGLQQVNSILTSNTEVTALTEATDCTDASGHHHAGLLIGRCVTGLHREAPLDGQDEAPLLAASVASGQTTNNAFDERSHRDSEFEELKQQFRELQTDQQEVRGEVNKLKSEIDKKNKELKEREKQLEDANEEVSQLKKKLDWKQEELEHEKESKQWMNDKIARLEEEKDKLQETIQGLKKQVDTLRQEMQTINNQKASAKDLEELQQRVEDLSHKEQPAVTYTTYTKTQPKDQMLESLEKCTMDFVKNISSLMRNQGGSTLRQHTSGRSDNIHTRSSSADDILSNSGQTRYESVNRTISDENNSF